MRQFAPCMLFVGTLAVAFAAGAPAQQVLVPGTGTRLIKVGDDFEDPLWAYNMANPKSSEENDKQQRVPGGASTNGRWYEGIKRGQPDEIRRVPTPPGGLKGSEGALLLRSLYTGVPGRHAGQNSQDDFICNVSGRIGGMLSPGRSPSVVVRVFLPPWNEWEQRTGNSFGFRAALQTYTQDRESRSRRPGMKWETYWPGMFIHFNKGDGNKTPDTASLLIRGGPTGHDFFATKITETGWWTLGMSFPPNGSVQYFAHPGVEDLTAADLITTQNPYGFRAERFDTFFFNIVNGDNGRWSTSWIIDDPMLYVLQ